MSVLGGYINIPPHHRQNRRRERPGSRTRRSISRKSVIKSNIQYDCDEGIMDAHDSSVPLPSDKARPSPLLRQNFDQSWQRWKARQAEEKALAEMDKIQLEQELLLFGGEVDDDELYRMGILYTDFDSNTVSCDVPIEQSPPMFVIRPGRRSRRRQPTWRNSLPLYLSFSGLSNDADIARLLSPCTPQIPTIQHRNTNTPTLRTTDIDIPQSLPPTSALESSLSGSPHLLSNTPTISSPQPDFDSGDWTFVSTLHTTPQVSTPSSEPETWILCDDS